MHCKCGGQMVDREKQENLRIVLWYKQCIACGRVYIYKDERPSTPTGQDRQCGSYST